MPAAAPSDARSDPWRAQGNVAPMLLEMQEGCEGGGTRKLAPPNRLRGAERVPAILSRLLRLANSRQGRPHERAWA